MRFSHILIGLGLTVASFNPSQLLAQSDSTVVAQVGNQKITAADLEKAESSKLLQARYTYYQAQSKALDELVNKTLLEQKARSEGLTVQQLTDRDVRSKIKDPSDDQMKVFYEGLGTDQPYDAVHDKILAKIREVRYNKALDAYLIGLKEKENVYVSLAPPSADVNLADANISGSKSAPIVLVEFADYECPYCQKVAADVKRLQTDFGGKVAIAFKDFPLPMHTHAEKAAEATRCAGEQGKYWELHDQIFQSKDLDVGQLKAQAQALKLDSTKFDQCLDSGETAPAVQKDRQEGIQLGLTGTPSFFVNGHFFSGAVDYAQLHQIIEQQLALAKAGTSESAKK